MANRVAIVGISDMKCQRRRDDATFSQLMFDAASEAVRNSNLTHKDIHYCMFATACENFNRQPLIFALVAETLGWAGKTLITFSNAGGSSGAAIGTAYSKIISGEAEVVLVVGGDKMSDGDLPGRPGFQNIIVHGCDSIFEVPFGSGVAQMGLVINHYKMTHGITEEQAAKVAVKNHGNAMLNPNAQAPRKFTVEDILKSPYIAYPIKARECSLITDGYAAAVFASGEVAKKLTDTPIWLNGISYANDVQKLGWREVINPGTELHDIRSAYYAAKQAYKMAGIKDPRKEIDVAEIQDGYSWFELMEYEALGFCGDGEGGKLIDEGVTELRGELPVNPSGGCIGHGHLYGGVGILTLNEVVKQLRGQCGDYQVHPIPKTGLALTMGGSGFNVCGVHILRR
jgi:acetyl-CoA C-acetyltransferase